MGYTTDFVGQLTIRPRLNEAEIEYLEAFADSRRFRRPGGPYVVPGNPRAEDSSQFPVDQYNQVAAGQPGLWCGWRTCWDGDCLAWSGHEKSYAMIAWLRYLIDHFLSSRGRAQGRPEFASFTFDHVLTGTVVACRRDTKELTAITVRDNRVRTRVLEPGDPAYADYPDLPYEREIDRWARPRRRKPLPGRDGTVVPLRQATETIY